jgi:hypothetical protein
MNRREFITLLGSAVAGWPLAVQAQQGGRTRRVGVLQNLASDDPTEQARLMAFGQGLQELGWTIGRNVRIDNRWSAGDPERIRRNTEEMVDPNVAILDPSKPLQALFECCHPSLGLGITLGS